MNPIREGAMPSGPAKKGPSGSTITKSRMLTNCTAPMRKMKVCSLGWRVIRTSSLRRVRHRALQLRMAEASDEVIVDHPDRLHEGVADGRADEAEPTADQGLAHAVRLARASRELSQRAARVLLGRSPDEFPEECVERPFLFLELEQRPRVRHGRLYLLAVAHDAGILQELRDAAAVIARHALRIEPVEHLEEMRPLVQDRGPRQPRLEAVEHELGEQFAVSVERHSPFPVVVAEHERARVYSRPAAPDDVGGRLRTRPGVLGFRVDVDSDLGHDEFPGRYLA